MYLDFTLETFVDESSRNASLSMVYKTLENAPANKKWKPTERVCSVATIHAPINVMPEGGGPRDRVGTLIRNKNLESNFLTLGIRFQFKVPHLGEGLACVASIPVRF